MVDVRGIAVFSGSDASIHEFLEDGTAIIGSGSSLVQVSGNVVFETSGLSAMADVSSSVDSPTSNQILKFDGNQWIPGSSAPWDGQLDGNAGITGSLYVTQTISGSTITGSIISASSLYGDGSGLTGVGGLPGGIDTSIQFNSVGTISGSSNLTYDYGTQLLALTGTLHASDITGSNITGSIVSGSFFYGDGSNLTGVTTSPAGATTQLQYNDGGDFGASANLTYDGAQVSLTGSLIIGTGHLNLTSSGGDNYLRGFMGFPRIQEISSSVSGIDAMAQELYDNKALYKGYVVYVMTGSVSALSGAFFQDNKFYFNEMGIWFPSPFISSEA